MLPAALHRLTIGAACLAAAAAVAGSATAGSTPAWSYVPAPLRTKLAVQSGGSLFLPARTPLFYRYRSGATVTGGALSATFRNRVRVRQGVWRWTRQTFLWRVTPLPAGGVCASWQAREKTMQLAGNRVFWSPTAAGGSAWRCVSDRRGRTLVLSASRGGKLPDVALGAVVASGVDVSRRAAAARVALSVAPRTVRRGGAVVVRGLAGDCPSSDTVTVLSRAFSPTHTFAGVPALLARVGTAGRFSASARIPSSRRPGSYLLTARCGGGNLGVSARLTVTR